MTLKIIGAGLARTGTKSLKQALELLGFGRCFHVVELLQDPARLSYLDMKNPVGSDNWDGFFDGFEAAVDYPACYYYETLLQQNPKAKVILTVREPEAWYASVRDTVYRGKPKGFKDIARLVKNLIFSADMRKVSPVFMYNDKLIWQGQFESKFEDKDFAIGVYKRHVAQVKETVPVDQLLVYDIKGGWEPLCSFLDRPIPSTPFPHTNTKAELNCKMDRLLIDGVFEP